MNTWGKIKFGKLYAIVSRNGVSKPSKIRGSGYPMINMGEIFRYDRINDSVKMELVPLDEKEKSNSFIKTGDLLFARQSLVVEGAGKCSIYIGVKADITFESHLIRVRLDNHLADPKYYYYYFSSYIGKSKIRSLVNQVAAAGIRGSELEKLEVDYPNLPTQSLIASVLSAYDDLIENNEKRIKAMEEMAQRLYTEWFVKFKFPGHEKTPLVDSSTEYGMIPEGWEVKRLDEVIKIVRGRSYSSEQISDFEGEYYIVNLKSFNRGGGFRLDGAKYYSGPMNNEQLLAQGDIVVAVTDMTTDRAVIARPARVPNILTHKITLSADVIKIENNEIPSSFIYYCLLEHRFTEATKLKANGANVLHLKPSSIAEYRAIIPPLKILSQFDVLCRPSIDEIDRMIAQNDSLEKLRDLLIPQLVSGRRLLK